MPPHLIPYLSKLKSANPCAVQEIQFSGPTFQVKIHDPSQNEELWTFIQLDPDADVVDALCSCKESEEGAGCRHLALSFLSLFEGNQPLHQRYLESFWYAMGKIWFQRYGKKPKGTGFAAESFTEEGFRLLELIQGTKIVETEENSIKFSNLSEEEIEAWKEGNPSDELRFELSGWSDFAKQLFLYRKPVRVVFKEGKGLPDSVLIEAPDLELKTRIEDKDWNFLIPGLNTIASNLKVFNRLADEISAINYDQNKTQLNLELKFQKERSGISANDWLYRPGSGFYPRQEVFMPNIQGKDIEIFFDRYGKEVAELLQGDEWNQTAVSLMYALKFDADWNLHINPYLFHKGDLQLPNVARFGKWLYMPSHGFYSVLNHAIILPERVEEKNISDFVRAEAVWLNQQAGFSVHLGSIETQVLYKLDRHGSLHFERRLPHKGNTTKDFGSWIYVKGEGFFNKVYAPIYLPIELGVPLRRDMVPVFIRNNRLELEQIPGFFSTEGPFDSSGIEISLDKDDRIQIDPAYKIKQRYQNHVLKFYEEWVYLEDAGFFELPAAQRLPEDLRDPVTVSKDRTKEFIEKDLPSLEKWVQKIDPRLIPPISIRLMLDHIEEADRYRWRIDIHYQTDRGRIPIEAIIEGLKRKEKYLFLLEGRVDLTEDRFQWIKRLQPGSIEKNYRLNLSLIELIRLHALEEIGAGTHVARLFQEVIDLKHTPPFNSEELKSVLRPYQVIGGEWMFSLSNYLLGGLLCDEMGLGKTHQAMALSAAIRKYKPKAKFLVVCPTSVLFHWEDKLKDFFPEMRVTTHHGTLRKKELEEDFDLLLTSYGILRRDINWLKKIRFDAVFFDEIQIAKNHRSKLYQALQLVTAESRFGLTGTPIENRLRELKALFDLVLPGYMPSEADYNKLIVRPIERNHDMRKKSLLHRLINPFVLRRKKIDVLRDLPEKTETVAHCELSPEQERLYRETLLIQGTEVLQDIVDVKKSVPFVHVFSLLSRLKQICDHPALYLKVPEEYHKYHSGKWNLFVELLQEARESQQKVVVYSQYLGMLDIIENYLKAEGIGFASLRGSTRDRKEQITLFAKDPACEVFVASLKAAGLGIDLTAASVVIHYDRWWNAARENQATDRVHRYGQSRGVQVFKLVTKNTFEERIDQIIERKKDLMDETIAFDDHEVMKSFTREELFELLQYQAIS